MRRGGDFGLLDGLGLAYLVDAGSRADAATTLVGSGAGLVAGELLANRRGYTAGDVGVVSTAGIVGAATGLALADLTGSDRGRPRVAAAMLGNLAGLAIGDRLVRHADFTEGQSRLVGLGSLAGGAVGLGLAFLIDGGDADDPTLCFALGVGGAAAGFGVMYRSQSAAAARPGFQRGGFRLDVDPLGLAHLTKRREDSKGAAHPRVPLILGSYRF